MAKSWKGHGILMLQLRGNPVITHSAPVNEGLLPIVKVVSNYS
jgi:hypothetical protein